jgi:MFS transporter, Spinster family, sphingosine-1-phosphate transporter
MQRADQKPGRYVERSARLALLLLIAINLLNYMDRYVLAAVQSLIIEELPPPGPDKRYWSGMLAPAFLLSYTLAAPLFNWLSIRLSRWILIGIAVIIWSLASGGSGLAPTYLILLATRVFVGIGEAAYGPVAPSVLADLYPIERRGRVLSWFYMAIPVGSALGYAVGGTVSSASGSWRMPFYVLTIPGLILGAACLLIRGLPGARPAGHGRTTSRDVLLLAKQLIHNRSYVLNTLGMTAMTFALGGLAFWMPDYVANYRKATSLAAASTIFGAITVVAGLLATLAGGIVGDRLTKWFSGAYFLVSGAGMLLGLPMFILVLLLPFPAAWVFIFLAEFCLFFNTGPTNTVLANVTVPSVRSTAFAINIFVIHMLGDVISPPLIGAVTDRFGNNMNYGFLCVSGAILLSGLFWLAGTPFLREDTDRAGDGISP